MNGLTNQDVEDVVLQNYMAFAEAIIGDIGKKYVSYRRTKGRKEYLNIKADPVRYERLLERTRSNRLKRKKHD